MFAERVDKLTGGQVKTRRSRPGRFVPAGSRSRRHAQEGDRGAPGVALLLGRQEQGGDAVLGNAGRPFGMIISDFLGWMNEAAAWTCTGSFLPATS